MVGFGISGLVRTARRATETLRVGLTQAERPVFVERLQRDLRWIDDLLEDEGRTEADLPAPSRRAFEALRRIAELPASALPTRPEGSVRPKQIVLRGAEGILDCFLKGLERGDAPPDQIEATRTRVRASADQMEDACRAAGGEIDALTDRSRRAYASMRWLASEGNFDRYVEAVARAVRTLPMGLAVAGGAAPSQHLVRFESGRSLWKSKQSKSLCQWRLSPGFIAADDADFTALAQVTSLRSSAPGSARERIHALENSEDFLATVAEIDRILVPKAPLTRGRAHDLEALFDRLDSTYFRGSIARPRMEWAPTLSRHRFGYFVAMHDVICMNPLLDDPSVPSTVVEFVLYHELLHKKHGTRLENGRRHSHTPEFRAEERLHPHFDEAERVTRALAGLPPAETIAPVTKRSPIERLSAHSQPSMPFPAARPLATPPRPSRNDPCPCGSGRKYKRCHLDQDESAAIRRPRTA